MAATTSLWNRFQKYFLSYADLDFSLDISRMRFADDFFPQMQPRIERAYKEMEELERGAIANPDENRMVRHYWLRNPELGSPNCAKRSSKQMRASNSLRRKIGSHFSAGICNSSKMEL